MYVIEVNDPYTRRPEYLIGFDPVTRKALWTRDMNQAIEFASSRSAQLLADEALLGRAPSIIEI